VASRNTHLGRYRRIADVLSGTGWGTWSLYRGWTLLARTQEAPGISTAGRALHPSRAPAMLFLVLRFTCKSAKNKSRRADSNR
jgi:hypothetical protein